MTSWFRCCPSGLGFGSGIVRSIEESRSFPGLGGRLAFGASMAFLDAFRCFSMLERHFLA